MCSCARPAPAPMNCALWIGSGARHPAPDVPHANLYDAMGKLKMENIFALTSGGTMGMPGREVDAGKSDKPGVMGGTMTMQEMMGMKSGQMEMGGKMKMDHDMSMKGKMQMDDMAMDHGEMTGEAEPSTNPHNGKKYTWDYVPLGPDVSSRHPLVIDGIWPRLALEPAVLRLL